MQPKARILVVDDDEVARELLVEALQKEGYDVESFGSGQEATERGQQIPVDLVLTDIRMGAVDGFQVLREFKRIRPGTPIVLLTAFGSLEGAIEAIKQGAYDYLAKPFRKEEVCLVVQRSLDHARLLRENSRFREELRERAVLTGLVGSSPAMLEVYKLVARVARWPHEEAPPPIVPLSERELDVVRLLSAGHSNREIAGKLFLAEGTVKNLITSVLSKLQVRDRTQAALRARELGLF